MDSEDAYSDDRTTSRKSKTKSREAAVSKGLSRMGSDASDRAAAISASIRPVQYKKGGKIRKKSRKAKGRRKSR
jgi:hypothetical protein